MRIRFHTTRIPIYTNDMRNLTPHRRFKAPPRVKASFRPFYKRPWPEDLPSECAVCGTAFRTNWNLQIGPNRIGRLLRKVSYYSLLPCLIGAFVLPLLFESIVRKFTDGNGGLWFFALIATPPLLAFLALVMPLRRHVECKKCGWNRDFQPFPPPKPDSTPPTSHDL